ncbi:HAD family hydrolase [Pseudomonas luteola]
MERFTVCLDLDETLIHSKEYKFSEGCVRIGPYWTEARPHLDEFLKSLSGFNVGIYTYATESYAQRIISNFFGDTNVSFLLSRNRCVNRYSQNPYGDYHNAYIKDLRKIAKHRRDLERFIAIDDCPYRYPRQYSNVIAVPEFTGGSDNVLVKLSRYLQYLSEFENVRAVEKRGWININFD